MLCAPLQSTGCWKVVLCKKVFSALAGDEEMSPSSEQVGNTVSQVSLQAV